MSEQNNANTVHQFNWGTLDVSPGIINGLNLSPSPSTPKEISWPYPVTLKWLTVAEARANQMIDHDSETFFVGYNVESDDTGVTATVISDTSPDIVGEIYDNLRAEWLEGNGKIADLFEGPVDEDFLEARVIGQFAVHSLTEELQHQLAAPLAGRIARLRDQDAKTDMLKGRSWAIINTICNTAAAFMCGVAFIASPNRFVAIGAGAVAGVAMGHTISSVLSARTQVKRYFDNMEQDVYARAARLEAGIIGDIHGAYCLTHTSDTIARLLGEPVPQTKPTQD